MGVKGCLTTIIAFIICAFFIGLIEKHTDAIVVIALVGLMLVIVAGVFYCRWNSKRKQAKEEARTLLDKIEKELRLPYSTPVIFTDDAQNQTTALQVYEQKQMFGILRYSMSNNSATYMVYRYHELDSWETDIQQTMIFGKPNKISSICIYLYINNQELTLTVHTGCDLDVGACDDQLRTMRTLERQLSYIKPSK